MSDKEQRLLHLYTKAERLANFIGDGETILDVGCGEGTFVHCAKELRRNGCEIVGIEINPKLAKKAKKYYNAVIIGDIENLEEIHYDQKYFDVIVFSDVLPQLKNPLNVLLKFRKWMKDDGKILLSMPNAAHWTLRLNFLFGRIEYHETGIWCWPQLRFFNKKASMALVSDAEFEITDFDVSPGVLLGGLRLRDKTKRRFSTFLEGLMRVFDKVLLICLKIDYLLSKLWPQLFAIQFIIIAKKKQSLASIHSEPKRISA